MIYTLIMTGGELRDKNNFRSARFLKIKCELLNKGIYYLYLQFFTSDRRASLVAKC